MNVRTLFYCASAVAFMMIASFAAHAQCSSKIELVKVVAPTGGVENGKIEIRVNSTGNYAIQLFSIDGASQKQIKTESGSGSRTIIFSNLNGNLIYNVKADFRDEQSFRCQKKSLTGIFLTEKQ